MSGIPTVEIRSDTGTPALPLIWDGSEPDSPIELGLSYSDISPLYNDIGSSGIIFQQFDIYENGSPMDDGRTFQTCSKYSGPIPYEHKSLPISLPTDHRVINAPVVYERGSDDNLWTCFYIMLASDESPSYVGFFRGRFHAPGVNCRTLPGHVPLFIDPDEVAGTWLETGEQPYPASPIGPLDSTAFLWCLASAGSQAGQYGVLPCIYGAQGVGTQHYKRLTLRMPDSTLASPSSYPEPSITLIGTDPVKYQGVIPCYRREDSHATYGWPGYTL